MPKLKYHTLPPTTKFTQQRIQKLCISDETKFLYMKKEKLNCALYCAHLRAAQEWGKIWCVIENYINRTLNEEI